MNSIQLKYPDGTLFPNLGGLMIVSCMMIFSAIVIIGCSQPTQPISEIAATASPSTAATQTPLPSQTVIPTAEPMEAENPISGYVISGGDTTPKDLLDAPRKFVYQIETENGVTVNVAYIAYPPSPVGDSKQMSLDFHAGGILIGDFLEAFGHFDKATNTFYIEEEKHFIKTYPEKP